MLSLKTVLLTVTYLSLSVFSAPLSKLRREVPQEHSHEGFVRAVSKNVLLNNPDNLGDAVFGLLGNAAAEKGQGDLQDPNCLQQALADRAFTNAKEAGDLEGQIDALIYRALERNSGQVGGTTEPCTTIQAVNPEIAAIQQHQDPASSNAAEVNKAITLELARQIASIGGDPLLALQAGTFAPGDVNDPTAKGNSCNDANDAQGCIFTLDLLVPDATEDEILQAVNGGNTGGNANDNGNNDNSNNNNGNNDNVTVTAAGGATTATATASSTAAAGSASAAAPGNNGSNGAAAGNLQTFTGNLGGATAPAVTAGGRGFQVEGSDDFLNLNAALGRSCDIQKNQCANISNSGQGDFSVSDCDAQATECRAAI
ncbi:hypothetical protein Moror_13960 [Moniliophthora roreri MCA 2997]|uniref:Uncharacterized protein n=1 Tax=Moniliophthora roreri (strain MCA 2997) TaxID=1381753 RepID=V2XQX3_MONRO|nr:hypothetical protein Moror_13960 [Moniliophthora roreri MCA 2997]